MSRFQKIFNKMSTSLQALGLLGMLLGFVGVVLFFLLLLALPTIAIYGVWNWFVVVQFASLGLKPIGWLVSFLISVVLGLIFRSRTVVKGQ